MKVYDVIDEQGIMTGFEIRNLYTERFLLKVLKSCPSISNIRRGSFFDEIRWYFQYCGVDCVIWEMFGDNSRLFILPEKTEGLSFKQLQDLKEHFAKYESYVLYILFYTILIIFITSMSRVIMKHF